MNKKYAVLGIAGAALVVSALVLYAVLSYDDPGLLHVCRGARGWAEYRSECPELCWSRKAPLVVSIPTSAVEAAHVRASVAALNEMAGFKVFEALPVPYAGDVGVLFGKPGGGVHMNVRGQARHRIGTDGCADYSYIELFEPTDMTLIHELLHAAGLAHDPDPASIMYPSTGYDLTDSDIAVLKGALL